MKIIDLLNMQVKGEEMPSLIKANGIKFLWDNDTTYYDEPCYRRLDEDADEFYTDQMITGFVSLKDEVEIINNVK